MKVGSLRAAVSIGAVMTAASMFCNAALATEGGGSVYANGVESFLSGAMPPPGFYPIVYGTRYRATALRDSEGNDIAAAVGGFRAEVTGVVPRFVWVTKHQVLGGQLAFHAIVPLLDVDVRVGSNKMSKRGVGDLNFATALGYHASDKLHYVFAFEVNAPTGKYSRSDVANVGRNYWMVEPLLAISYIQPRGLNADLKLMLDYNFRNTDTDYRSGRELHADYAVGWGLGNGWVLGAGGYLYRQVSDDHVGGTDVAGGNRGRAFALGPVVKYQSKNGWFLTAKYENQYDVRNRADGGAFWVKTIVPF
ncbi:transporter [Massilia sp. LXY-6]|uniref:SphA family protein n=1 Tax=Massilia sp. LXY-6 TaxID=3379823 RepID=UPI003EE02B4E